MTNPKPAGIRRASSAGSVTLRRVDPSLSGPPASAALAPPRPVVLPAGRILIVSDAWQPTVNGVVRTLESLTAELRALGHAVLVIGPDRFFSLPLPSYPEVRLAVQPGRRLRAMIEAFAPTAIHIATEGPLGLAARRHCLGRRLPFTTAFHTRFPEYLACRLPIPPAWSYAALRRFHAPAAAVMVATPRLERALLSRGFARLRQWTRGVDTDLFRPRDKGFLAGPRPIALYVGRVAVEKNLEAFLGLDLPGCKYVVGDGPQLRALRRRHPEVRFVGYQQGEALARCYAAADVFVFPSRTDTFGLVLLEALACGVPVAAYDVPGPLDVIGEAAVGCLDADLGRAAMACLGIAPAECRRYAQGFSWQRCAEQFLDNLRPFC
jgi:glycosyltransferase involved in cell wall biosynthesis